MEDCAQVLRCIASSSSCPAQYGLTLLSVVRHLARVCLHGSRNQLSPRTLAESFSPVLFRLSAGSVPLATFKSFHSGVNRIRLIRRLNTTLGLGVIYNREATMGATLATR